MAKEVGNVGVYETIGKSNEFDLISNPIGHYNFTPLKGHNVSLFEYRRFELPD